MKTFLHVGCGHQTKSGIKGFDNDFWNEIRFDIDKNVNPDIEGTLTDMSQVKTESVDAIYSSHNIEHIFIHEVPIALKEFHRVLKKDGMVVIECPDLQSTCESVVNDKLLEPLYHTEAGAPITPLDIIYGHVGQIAQGNKFMAHKCGFTYSTLLKEFIDAGFNKYIGGRRLAGFDLFLVACKGEKSDEDLNKLASEFLP